MAGELTQPAPGAPETISGGDRIIEEVGKTQGLTPELIAKAKEQYKARGERAAVRVTREALGRLASEVGQREGISESDQDKINRVLLITERALALERFRELVHQGDHDFMGDDSNYAEVEANPVFQEACKRMEEIYASTDPAAPIEAQSKWMQASTAFMVKEIAGWSGLFTTRMDVQDVDAAIKKTLDRSQGGVGTFDEWMKAPEQKADADKWQKEASAKAEEAQKLEGKKKEITDVAVRIETRLTSLPPAIVPTALLTEVRDLKTKIAQDSGANLETYRTSLTASEGKIPALEALRPIAEDANVPEDQRAKVLAEVQNGAKTPEQAKSDLEKAKADAAAARQQAEEADAPALDKLAKLVDSMEEGKLKKVAGAILVALTGLAAALAKAPLIGGWIRRNFISNRMLAAKGDRKAEIAIRAEDEFRKFGLGRDIANQLGDKKTKDVVKILAERPADLTTDAAQQKALAQLRTQLEARGGATNEATLFEFMGANPGWTGIQYQEAAVATAPAATPAQAQTAAPATQPQAGPAAPEAPGTKVAAMFEGMTPDDKAALEGAKIKDVVAGTLPPSLAENDRAKKIAAKLKANSTSQVLSPDTTVKAYLDDPANIDKDWKIA